jgi:hypothetical protein
VQGQTGSLAYWIKRTIVFPIGERWALIAIAAAVFDQRVALVAILVWGVLAAAYTLVLRSVRARSMRVSVLDSVDASRYLDHGPLVGLLLRWVPAWRGGLDWLVPAVLRALEFGVAIAICRGFGVAPALTYTLLFALSLHHYDLTARLEKRLPAPPLRRFALGWDGRVVLLTLGSLAGLPVVVVTVLVVDLLLVTVADTLMTWWVPS